MSNITVQVNKSWTQNYHMHKIVDKLQDHKFKPYICEM